MKKILASALIAAMSLSLLAGCGSSSDETSTNTGTVTTEGEVTDVSLKVWCPQNQIEFGLMAEQQAAFAALHPEWNITWKTEAVGEDNAKTEIMKDVEMAADVFMYSNDQVVELVEAKAIARLGGETEKMVNETMKPDVVKTVTVNDALYGIPFTHNTFFMYYDKTLLTEEDIKSLDAIVAKDTAEGVYNFNFDSAGGWKSGAWYYGAGLSLFGANGDDLAAGCDWNSEKGIAVTNYLIDLLANKKVGNGLPVEELAREHKIGAWFDGAWNYDKYYEALGDDLGMASLPTYTLNGTEVQLRSFYGTKAIGVNAKSKNLAAAIAFANFLGTEEQQIARFKNSPQVPTNTNAAAIDEVQNHLMSKVILEQSENYSVMQPTARIFSSRYWNYADSITTNIKTGTTTKDNVQKAMDDFVTSITAQ